ncbi:thioredoxin domain-containing protein [Candidatus Hydrogenosomobacter endosymbioticus]|uniref:Thioredoxin-like fold domain-containing protein n=1 Tax=Candidatus Hydrogenosomobacter endosymbioticus TaxID=2558174 RepID=A0ABM7V987_9PROT|nr:thioredoxin domain-containing protein [Candidatus Hydrogenosomobacter endosymbioticus]BDB96063.1 hypothetical protein HYD_1960 [Candidatus Hydrogenosomobacter endosymbioticus]
MNTTISQRVFLLAASVFVTVSYSGSHAASKEKSISKEKSTPYSQLTEKRPLTAAEFLFRNVIKEHPSGKFMDFYGDVQKAPMVFVYYISMICPDCIKCYLEIFPKLIASKEFKEKKFALVVVDHPYDRLSMNLTAFAWSAKKTLASDIRKILFTELRDNKKLTEAVEKKDEKTIYAMCKEVLLKNIKHPEDKPLIENAMQNEELLRIIFDARVRNRMSPLSINGVPTAFFVSKKGEAPSSWKVIEMKSPSDGAEIVSLVKENSKAEIVPSQPKEKLIPNCNDEPNSKNATDKTSAEPEKKGRVRSIVDKLKEKTNETKNTEAKKEQAIK